MKRVILILFLIAFGLGTTYAAEPPDYIPFERDRHTLYTRDELWKDYNSIPVDNKSLDWAIYDKYFDDVKKYAPPLDHLRMQRQHDAGMEYAVNEFFKVGADGVPTNKRVVSIMGSHSRTRSDQWYKNVARLAYALSKADYFVVSGGGPGYMEAAHLGAYMAKHYSPKDLETALDMLDKSATFENPQGCEPKKKQYEMCDYWKKALEVTSAFKIGGESLGIPTWFYGHEGANAFSLHVAKFFSNALREEKLSAVGSHGVIFAPGGPGTAQEVFMDAAQNAYHSYNSMSPMVFFNDPFNPYVPSTHVPPRMVDLVTSQTSKEYGTKEMLLISNDPQEIIKFLDKKSKVFCKYGDPECLPRQ